MRIGSAGWNVPRASAGNFPSPGTHLERYARVLTCAEINTTFYRPHRRSTWERWRDSVPEDFRFSVKAPKAITHEAELRCEPIVLDEFLDQVRFLDRKLGPLLFQLPPSLQFERRVAGTFMKLLRERFSGAVVWEPRHPTWFSEDASELLLKYGIARVAADPACVPSAAQPGDSDKLAYFRLHGSPRRYYSSYTEAYLIDFATRLQELRGRAGVWCIFDNTASGAALQNALDVDRQVKARER